MPIKRVSIKHLLTKGFCKKTLNTISETGREQCPKVFLTEYMARSEYTKFPKYFVLSRSKIVWNILWNPDEPKQNLFWKILWKEFLKYLFGNIAFNFKILLLLEIFCLKNILGWNFWEKFHTVSNRVNLEKGMFLTHRFYFLIAQAFFSLIKKYYTRFYLKKISKIFVIIGFSKQSRVWASIEKKN